MFKKNHYCFLTITTFVLKNELDKQFTEKRAIIKKFWSLWTYFCYSEDPNRRGLDFFDVHINQQKQQKERKFTHPNI